MSRMAVAGPCTRFSRNAGRVTCPCLCPTSPLNNPYVPLQAKLRDAVYLGGPGYGESLLAMTGLLGISMCLILASLWLRIVQRRGGEVWLFRVQRGEAGKFITPHYVYSVLFLSAIFIIFEILKAYKTWRFATVGSDLSQLIFWKGLEIVPLWICGWLIAWSTALQPMHVTTRPPSKHPLDLARYPLLVNSFFVIVPLAFTALMIGFTAVANTHVKELIPLYLQLDAGLTNATKQFDLGRAVDFFALEELGLQLTTSIDEVAHWWRLSIMTLLGFDCLLIAITTAASTAYFIDLNKSITWLAGSLEGNSQAKLALLRSSHRSLLLTIFTVLLLEISFATLLILVPTFEAAPRKTIAILTVMSVAIYAFFGIFINLGLFLRSYHLPKDNHNNATTASALLAGSTTAVEDRTVLPISLDQFDEKVVGKGQGETAFVSGSGRASLER